MRKIRCILSIDGGGIRGVLPLTILNALNQRLQRVYGISVNQGFDLMAGTSTGAIISAALLLKDNHKFSYQPSDLLKLYQNRGSQIFNPNRDKTNQQSLPFILQKNFSHLTVSQLDKRFVFLSYDEKTNAPFTFTNTQSHFRNVPISKVLMACSAVKPHFDPVELGPYLLSDGYIFNKNPASIALDYSKMYFPDDLIILISIGTGKPPKTDMDEIEQKALKTHLILTELQKKSKDFKYIRFQPKLKRADFTMDNTSEDNITALTEDGKDFVKQNQQMINEIAAVLGERELKLSY
ncbi:MAG: patatin-like phospholipase family protein [Crocinitomicaceae bacterium]|nr:patatin-like phospholipase family protein [Crocinitomicaceae bacterium]